MTLRCAAALLIAAGVTTTATLADVKGAPNSPTFTAEEMALIRRHPKLVAAARDEPWKLRQALDVWEESRAVPQDHASEQAAQPPHAMPEEGDGRASAEASLDLLQILREAAGQGTKR